MLLRLNHSQTITIVQDGSPAIPPKKTMKKLQGYKKKYNVSLCVNRKVERPDQMKSQDADPQGLGNNAKIEVQSSVDNPTDTLDDVVQFQILQMEVRF